MAAGLGSTGVSVTSDTLTSAGLRELAVSDAETGQRLDRYLAGACPDMSRSRLRQLIDEGRVTQITAGSNITIKDANHRVKPGEHYKIEVPAPVSASPVGQDIPLDVVYEDDDLIVINKPAGLVVHPAAGNPDGTLVNALIAHCGNSLKGLGGEVRPGIVHRLDKDTSGLMVAAKNERAMHSLAKQFANHTIERAYHALVWGSPRLGEGRIETQIGRNPYDRKRMGVMRSGGKEARTRYRVEERFGEPTRPLASLIECRLETGRTHQIRVHLTHLGHPLLGDPTYGKSRQAPRAKTPEQEAAYRVVMEFPRQALHAYILGFQHPSLHKSLHFESVYPTDMSNLLSALRLL